MNFISFISAQHIGLLILAIFVLAYVIGISLIIYDLFRFGVGHKPRILALSLIIVSLFALASSVIFYKLVDWTMLFKELPTYARTLF